MLSSELWCTLTCTPRIYKYNELKCQTSTQQYRKCTTHSIHKVYHTHSRNDSLDEKGQSLVLVEIYACQKFALKKGGSLAQCTCFELRLVKHHPRVPEWTACMTSDLPCRNIRCWSFYYLNSAPSFWKLLLSGSTGIYVFLGGATSDVEAAMCKAYSLVHSRY